MNPAIAFKNSLLIFLGAGLGANARYWLGAWVQKLAGSTFPWSTVVINISGSIVIGAFFALFERLEWSPEWRLFVAIGILGGYTTFSSFSYETLTLLRDGSIGPALANILLSNVLSIGGCWLAFAGVRSLVRG